MDYTHRWQHHMKFTFRVWPSNRSARRMMREQTELKVLGYNLNMYDQLEAAVRIRDGAVNTATFELNPHDAEVLLSMGGTGIDMSDHIIRCPGSIDEKAGASCHLEIAVTVYRYAHRRTGKNYKYEAYSDWIGGLLTCTDDEIAAKAEEYWRKHNSYRRCTGVVMITKRRQLEDIDAIAAAIMEDKVVVAKTEIAHGRLGPIRKRLAYYTIPGRRPDEPGGLFHGYQLCDGLMTFSRSYPEAERPALRAERFERMHESQREKGRATRRAFLVSGVIDKIAARYGVSRELVTRRFNEEGVVSHLLKRAEAVQLPKVMREAKTIMSRHVNESVDWLRFYIDGFGTSFLDAGTEGAAS